MTFMLALLYRIVAWLEKRQTARAETSPLGRLQTIGVHHEITTYRYRCSQCHEMQPAGSLMFWFPVDGFVLTEAVRILRQAIERNHGQFSAWCVRCARQVADRIFSDRAETPVWRETPEPSAE